MPCLCFGATVRAAVRQGLDVVAVVYVMRGTFQHRHLLGRRRSAARRPRSPGRLRATAEPDRLAQHAGEPAESRHPARGDWTRGISIKQPHTTCILTGAKGTENRTARR